MIPSVTEFGKTSKSTPKNKTGNTSGIKIFGCDTETYSDGDSRGLKSIQIYGNNEQHYFTVDDWQQSDNAIRYEICKQFFDWLLNLTSDSIIAFFNLTFDSSQFLKYMITQIGYEVATEGFGIEKGTIKILESDRKVYSIQLRNEKGRSVKMIDIANFLVGVTLDKACKSWLGRGKVAIESKIFPKCGCTDIEKEYAMEDAHLTYDLFNVLCENDVIEGEKTVTIAGRTIRHFIGFLMANFHLTFEEYFYDGADSETIENIKADLENKLRPGVRGGNVIAFQTGVFENCIHYDARSMYPTQCVKPLIPIGGLLDKPPSGNYTSIVYPSGCYTLKENRVPCIQWRTKLQTMRFRYINDYDTGEFVSDFYLDGSYPIWKDEYDIIKDTYDVENETIEKEYYIKMVENVILKRYVEELYKGKMTNTGSKKLYYKYLLNALYGKFLSRPDGTSIAYVQLDGEWKRIKTQSFKKIYYLPLGSWIAM